MHELHELHSPPRSSSRKCLIASRPVGLASDRVTSEVSTSPVDKTFIIAMKNELPLAMTVEEEDGERLV